jgi:hypothetical protein
MILLTYILLLTIFYLSFIIYYLYKNTISNIDYLNCKNNYKFNFNKYEKIKDKIKSGDILLFSSYYPWPISRLYNNIKFQHYGIVIRENDKLYCLECNTDIIINNKKYKNIIKIDLKERLLNYPGNVYISHLRKELTNNQEKFLHEFNTNYKRMNEFEHYLSFVHNIDFTKYNKFSCITLIYYILKKINIINENINVNQLCTYFTNLVLQNNIYKYPYEIIHKELLTKKYNNKNIIYYNKLFKY